MSGIISCKRRSDRSFLRLRMPLEEEIDPAHYILAHISNAHSKLDVSRFTTLGNDGLAAVLGRLSVSPGGSRGLVNKWEMMSFRICELGDMGLAALLALSLAGNRGLLSKSVVTLFDSLSSSTLATLNLSDCDLGPEVVEAIGKYLCSTRSRTLRRLVLSRNRFGLEEIRGIVDADAGEDEKVKQELARLHTLYRRNKDLADRVKQAAARCLPYARILLNATPDTSLHPSTPSDTTSPCFRLLDLPFELVVHITRHTSGDPTALSDAQFLRLQQEAEGREGLARAIKQGATVLKETMAFHELNRGLRPRPRLTEEDWRLPMRAEDLAHIHDRLKADWLKAVDCEKWECNV
ncbi:uncharacterized protein MKK02DRAFT_39335 [Dioszegia hungarica]|uniref:RNI-like protein n=1 Tax=Dioszegia hungarica TaxID=4972 RepID=A0AA38H6T9_9TREE|nr:uncharacterized protein MKK02DRAFT_39335 [Dioszegia hungarica]KAI9633354.1 hypothetical protein MKK02DRAFT_39335 [Dioszegia hungarica]